jgi:hypothetical protein
MKGVFYELVSQTEGHIEYFNELHYLREYLEDKLQDIFKEYCADRGSNDYEIVQLRMTRDMLIDKKCGGDLMMKNLVHGHYAPLHVKRISFWHPNHK